MSARIDQRPKALSTDWLAVLSLAALFAFLARRFSLRPLAATFLVFLLPLSLEPISTSRLATKNGRQVSLSHTLSANGHELPGPGNRSQTGDEIGF